jgi:hypothetical protein
MGIMAVEEQPSDDAQEGDAPLAMTIPGTASATTYTSATLGTVLAAMVPTWAGMESLR